MSEKTAIEKMVAELECLVMSTEGDKYTDPSESWRGYCNALDLARRLASLEANEKPTAPAELVEELEKVCKVEPQIIKEGREYETELICKGRLQIKDRVKEILSRYRPVPTADIVGELKEWFRIHYDGDRNECGAKAFKEIIRKWEAK